MDDPVAESFSQVDKDLIERIEQNLERGGRVAADLDKTLISLSAGALVFSMTFVSSLAPAKLALWVLFLSWAAFGTSMLSVIFAIRNVQNALVKGMGNLKLAAEAIEQNKPIHSFFKVPMQKLTTKVTNNLLVERLNILAISAFVLGVLLLGVFVGYNLWYTPVK